MRTMLTGIRSIAGCWALVMAGLMIAMLSEFVWLANFRLENLVWDFRGSSFGCNMYHMLFCGSYGIGRIAPIRMEQLLVPIVISWLLLLRIRRTLKTKAANGRA